MASIHGVVNHIKYIRSNSAVLAAGSALFLGAAIVAGPVIEAAGNAQAYHSDGRHHSYTYSDYSDDYGRYADNYDRYSDNYGKYLDNYKRYVGYHDGYGHDRGKHDDKKRDKKHHHGKGHYKDYADYRYDDDRCGCYEKYYPVASEDYSLDTPYYYGGRWHSEPTPEPTPTYEPEPEPTDEPTPTYEPEPDISVPASSSSTATAVANVTVNKAPQRVVKQTPVVVQAKPASTVGAGTVYVANPKGGPIELPQTGAEDNITGIIGLASAVLAGSLYAASRRELKEIGFEH